MPLTNAALAEQVSALIQKWATYTGQLNDWLAGTATGGPYNDGRYPLQNSLGTVFYVPSPAAMAASVNGTVASAQAYATAADTAKAAAEAAQSAAEAARSLALSYRDAAIIAKNQAEQARNEAATSAANCAAIQTALSPIPKIYVQEDDPIAAAGSAPVGAIWIWTGIKRSLGSTWVTIV